MDAPIGSISLVYRQVILAVDRAMSIGPPWLSTGISQESVLCRLVQSVERPIGQSTVFGLWAVFKMDSEFVSDMNSEFLVFFSS